MKSSRLPPRFSVEEPGYEATMTVYLAEFANETDLFTERQSHEIFWLDCSIKLGWVI